MSSKAFVIADAIAARLTSQASLAGVTCMVDRQKDIATEVAKSVAKISACCVVVLYDGFKNPDAALSGNPSVIRSYTVSVFGKPVLAGTTGMLAADVMEIAAIALHNWVPDEATTFIAECNVTGGDYRPDKYYLIFELSVDVTSKL